MNCACHGEPARWDRSPRYTAGGYWTCRVREAATKRARYARLDGVAYNKLLLKHRRTKALARHRGRTEED